MQGHIQLNACTYKILCKTILFTKQMAQCVCTVNAHAHSRQVKGVSFHKILSDSSQTVTDISGNVHNYVSHWGSKYCSKG